MTDGFPHEMMTERCPCLSSSWASEDFSTEGTSYTEQLESRRACLSREFGILFSVHSFLKFTPMDSCPGGRGYQDELDRWTHSLATVG